jgi:hypothetical protein
MGLLWITVLVLTLVSMAKEGRYDEPVKGLFSLTLIVISLCTFIALCSAYQSAKSSPKFSQGLSQASGSDQRNALIQR